MVVPTLAQVTQAPPIIEFPQWKEVDRPEGSIEYLVSFPSPVVSPYEVNNTVPLRIFIPDDVTGPVPVVLVTHYWGATDLRVERALADELNHRGIAAALLTLPYHLSRTPAGKRSGELAIEPDPAKMIATTTQAVLDARRSIDFLMSRPEFRKDQVGLAGTSLGAVVAALTYGVEPRITHAAFLLGGADLAHILWTSSRVQPQREILRRRGYTEEKLRLELEPIEPLTYLRSRTLSPTFVVGGRYDTVIPRSSTQGLIGALGDSRVLWLDTGHYGGIFVQRRLMREVASFFASEFAGKNYVAPPKLYAPTIRVGVSAASGTGLNLGAGADIWRSDARGDYFGTFFVTPRGPQVFVGRSLGQGLAIGASGSTHHVGVGFFWSAVL